MGFKKIIVLFFVLFMFVLGTSVYFVYRSVEFEGEEEDFVYLSNILYKETKDIDGGAEKLKKMTEWLHRHVKHTSFYPVDFNGNGVANVIKGGVGNCGYQSANISVLADILGYPNHRIYHFQKSQGSKYDHTFAEIEVDGRWMVFDPDILLYQVNQAGDVLGMQEMKSNPELISNELFQELITQDQDSSMVFTISKSRQSTPKPFGDGGYKEYVECGGFTGFKLLMVWRRYGLKLIVLSVFITGLLLLFLGFIKKG